MKPEMPDPNWKDSAGNLYTDNEVMWSGMASGFVTRDSLRDNLDHPENWLRVFPIHEPK